MISPQKASLIDYIDCSPSGTCCGTILSESDAYIMFWMTHEDYRGQGFGGAIIRAILASLGGRNVILDAVEGTPSVYAKYGFKVTDTLNFYRIKLKPIRSIPLAAAHIGARSIVDADVNVEQVTEETIESMSKYEQDISDLERKVMFTQIWSCGENSCFVSKTPDGAVTGYAVVKNNEIISHLCANDLDTARALFRTCVETMQSNCREDNSITRFHSFESRSPMIEKLVEDFIEGKLSVSRKVYRMATRSSPPMKLDRIFAMSLTPWFSTQ